MLALHLEHEFDSMSNYPKPNLLVIPLPVSHHRYLPPQVSIPFVKGIFQASWEMDHLRAAGVGNVVTFQDCFGCDTTWLDFMEEVSAYILCAIETTQRVRAWFIYGFYRTCRGVAVGTGACTLLRYMHLFIWTPGLVLIQHSFLRILYELDNVISVLLFVLVRDPLLLL